MTIESKIDRTNELLEALLTKFDHIATQSASTTLVEVATDIGDVVGAAPLEEAAKSTSKRKARRTKAQIAADNQADLAATTEEVTTEEVTTEEDDGELPPDAKTVKTAQEFKKEIVALGRASGQASYVSVIKGVLIAAGFEKAENVTEDSYDKVIALMTEAFANEDDL